MWSVSTIVTVSLASATVLVFNFFYSWMEGRADPDKHTKFSFTFPAVMLSPILVAFLSCFIGTGTKIETSYLSVWLLAMWAFGGIASVEGVFAGRRAGQSRNKK